MSCGPSGRVSTLLPIVLMMSLHGVSVSDGLKKVVAGWRHCDLSGSATALSVTRRGDMEEQRDATHDAALA